MIDRLTSPYAPHSAQNYLSFLSDLSPQFLHEFPMLSFIRLQLCLIVDMHGQRVPACSRGTLNSSFHGMRKRFCSCSVSPRINSALLHVRWKSEAMVEKPKRTCFSPFKCNVIIQHCQAPSTPLLRVRSQCALFPGNISITLCCMSDGNRKQIWRKHSGPILHL